MVAVNIQALRDSIAQAIIAAYATDLPDGQDNPIERADREDIPQASAFLVCGYAPNAPAPVLKVAALRVAAYLYDSAAASLTRADGDTENLVFIRSFQNALRTSGALGMLAPWRKRRFARPVVQGDGTTDDSFLWGNQLITWAEDRLLR